MKPADPLTRTLLMDVAPSLEGDLEADWIGDLRCSNAGSPNRQGSAPVFWELSQTRAGTTGDTGVSIASKKSVTDRSYVQAKSSEAPLPSADVDGLLIRVRVQLRTRGRIQCRLPERTPPSKP